MNWNLDPTSSFGFTPISYFTPVSMDGNTTISNVAPSFDFYPRVGVSNTVNNTGFSHLGGQFNDFYGRTTPVQQVSINPIKKPEYSQRQQAMMSASLKQENFRLTQSIIDQLAGGTGLKPAQVQKWFENKGVKLRTRSKSKKRKKPRMKKLSTPPSGTTLKKLLNKEGAVSVRKMNEFVHLLINLSASAHKEKRNYLLALSKCTTDAKRDFLQLEGGLSTLCSWLTDAIDNQNNVFIRQSLFVVGSLPLTITRIKEEGLDKIVKKCMNSDLDPITIQKCATRADAWKIPFKRKIIPGVLDEPPAKKRKLKATSVKKSEPSPNKGKIKLVDIPKRTNKSMILKDDKPIRIAKLRGVATRQENALSSTDIKNKLRDNATAQKLQKPPEIKLSKKTGKPLKTVKWKSDDKLVVKTTYSRIKKKTPAAIGSHQIQMDKWKEKVKVFTTSRSWSAPKKRDYPAPVIELISQESENQKKREISAYFASYEFPNDVPKNPDGPLLVGESYNDSDILNIPREYKDPSKEPEAIDEDKLRYLLNNVIEKPINGPAPTYPDQFPQDEMLQLNLTDIAKRINQNVLFDRELNIDRNMPQFRDERGPEPFINDRGERGPEPFRNDRGPEPFRNDRGMPPQFRDERVPEPFRNDRGERGPEPFRNDRGIPPQFRDERGRKPFRNDPGHSFREERKPFRNDRGMPPQFRDERGPDSFRNRPPFGQDFPNNDRPNYGDNSSNFNDNRPNFFPQGRNNPGHMNDTIGRNSSRPPDFEHRNNHNFRAPPPMHGRGTLNIPCKFFNGPTGCKNGSNCKFLHEKVSNNPSYRR
eukprot:TRINITY_DN1610_c0_g1_i4.p1 TRINITY_DN1610_c0_g1~~TRINITY_DN1610_c0_g1_i4.p1  ORF type:complete len:814 (-),score=176.31 TRINITY_DN1610_c0_g1_i4:46-2487(-)